MKKRIILILVSLMMVLFIFPTTSLMASEEVCITHTPGTPFFYYEPIGGTAEGCVVREHLAVKCIICNVLLGDAADPYLTLLAHDWKAPSIGPHTSSGKHDFTQSCKMCGIVAKGTYSCNGPPCNNFMSPVPVQNKIFQKINI